MRIEAIILSYPLARNLLYSSSGYNFISHPFFHFFFQAEDGIRDLYVTGVQTCALPILGGLDVPTRGTITVAGDEITHMSGNKLTEWRARHVGFVFQMYNLIPVLTAFQRSEERRVGKECRSRWAR